MNHCFMHTDCCTANGPRGFLCFLRRFFRKSSDVATFNFYASAGNTWLRDNCYRTWFPEELGPTE